MSHVELNVTQKNIYQEGAEVFLSTCDNSFELTISTDDDVKGYKVSRSEMKKLYKFLEANQELFVEPEVEEEEIPVTYGMIRNTIGWSRFCEVTGNTHDILDLYDFNPEDIFHITKSQFNELW